LKNIAKAKLKIKEQLNIAQQMVAKCLTSLEADN
jgi:hypothetical protein